MRRPRRRARASSPEPQQRLRRPVTCGKCMGVGHNARSCQRRAGVQTVYVDPRTNRRTQEREVATTSNGVGVYIDPYTGNSYYSGGSSRPAMGSSRADEVVQPTPPP
ncbi:hypothetical protein LINGRAHAP2_LOCUS23428, partial [Linum grandiflorum]